MDVDEGLLYDEENLPRYSPLGSWLGGGGDLFFPPNSV